MSHPRRIKSSNILFNISNLSKHAYILVLPVCLYHSRNPCSEDMKQKMLKIKYYSWLIYILKISELHVLESRTPTGGSSDNCRSRKVTPSTEIIKWFSERKSQKLQEGKLVATNFEF